MDRSELARLLGLDPLQLELTETTVVRLGDSIPNLKANLAALKSQKSDSSNRVHDDSEFIDLSSMQQPSRKRKRIDTADEEPVVDAWNPPSGVQSIKSKLLALHVELNDFSNFLSPTSDDDVVRSKLVLQVQALLSMLWPSTASSDGAQIRVFGSSATGLSLPTSDIDLCAFGTNDISGAKCVFLVAELLKRYSSSSTSLSVPAIPVHDPCIFIEAIASARVRVAI